ncbi:hypothetical protein KI387_009502, partial [Taxus chinensis]
MEQRNRSDAISLPRWESFLINSHEFGGDFPAGPYNRMISKLYGTGGESLETINRSRMDDQYSNLGSADGEPLYPVHRIVQSKSSNRSFSASVQPRQNDMATSSHSVSQRLPGSGENRQDNEFGRLGLSGAQAVNGEQVEPSRNHSLGVWPRLAGTPPQPQGITDEEIVDSLLGRSVTGHVSPAGVPETKLDKAPATLVSADVQSKEHNDKVKVDAVPPGVIFMCNRKTRETCFQFGLFGLPGSQINMVKRIVPGTKLFLFVLDSREMQGIFEATSNGGLNLSPMAFGGAFPSQVRFRICRECKPLAEKDFRKAIEANYFAYNKFKNELTSQQVSALLQLFCPEGFVDGKVQSNQNLLLGHLIAGGTRGYSALDRAETQSEKSMDISPKNSPSVRCEEDIYGKERDYLTNSRVANGPYSTDASGNYFQISLYGSTVHPRGSSVPSHMFNEQADEDNFHLKEKHQDSPHPLYTSSALQSKDGAISGLRFSEGLEKGKFQAHDSLEASDASISRSSPWFQEQMTGNLIEQNRVLQSNPVDGKAFAHESDISGQERAEYLNRVYDIYEQEQLRPQEDLEVYASQGLPHGRMDEYSLHNHKRVSEDTGNNTSNSNPWKKSRYYSESYEDIMLKERVPSVNDAPVNADWMRNASQ